MADFPPSSASGILWTHYTVEVKDFAGVTDSYEFEDAGRTFNRRTSSPPQKWTIQYTGLTSTQAGYFNTFWNSYGIDTTFTFLDKAGATQTGVRFESFNVSHDAHFAWINTVDIVLVKYS